MLWLLTGMGLLELQHLIYPRYLTGFGMLVFFTNLSLMEFQVRYLALFLLFSVIDSFEWFWMESLHKNIQLKLEFLKIPFLVLQLSFFCFYWNQLLNFNLNYKTLWTGVGSDFLISVVKKLNCFDLTSLITLALLM